MKRSEPSPETLRSSAQLRDRKPGEPSGRPSEVGDHGKDEFHPQYLELPPRSGGGGVRNVLLGMLLVFGAALLLSYATFLAGPRAVLPLGVALLTAITLFALARLRIFRQRNGGFVALGLVCLLGVLVPLIEYVWTRDNGAVAQSAAIEDPADEAEKLPAGAKTIPRSLKEAFSLPTPPEGTAGFRVLQDLRVEIDGKKYVINEGDVFAIGEMTGEDVRFSAGDEQIALPLNMVEMIGSPAPGKPVATATPSTPPAANPANVANTPQQPGPVNITEEAQREAIRRYPAIGMKNSPENMLFVETYQELKHSGADDFFANPEWPLALAEMLAKREKWNQPGQASPPSTSDGAAMQDEPRPKRRPVAEELDEPEMEAAPAPAPSEPVQAGGTPAAAAADPDGELPAE